MTEPYTIIRLLFELVGTTSLDRNYRGVINLSFVLPILFHLDILKTENAFQRKRLKRGEWILCLLSRVYNLSRFTVFYIITELKIKFVFPQLKLQICFVETTFVNRRKRAETDRNNPA